MEQAAVTAVALYAGLLALVGIWLALHVGRLRGQLRIFIGDGGHPRMIRAMRGQANFVESVPMALLLMLLAALLGAPVWLLHAGGIALVAGRILHGMHFMAEDAPRWQRAAGAGLTMLVLALGGIGVAAHALARMF
ncbi:MAG: hypothetical protein KatS3mg118_0114 [Paracoccaceae bacterium]|nr:MAG: hypothetical protein KatS3mg118_0114 [Paracoccaceae bacterium]